MIQMTQSKRAAAGHSDRWRAHHTRIQAFTEEKALIAHCSTACSGRRSLPAPTAGSAVTHRQRTVRCRRGRSDSTGKRVGRIGSVGTTPARAVKAAAPPPAAAAQRRRRRRRVRHRAQLRVLRTAGPSRRRCRIPLASFPGASRERTPSRPGLPRPRCRLRPRRRRRHPSHTGACTFRRPPSVRRSHPRGHRSCPPSSRHSRSRRR